jgi:hypothetical protein
MNFNNFEEVFTAASFVGYLEEKHPELDATNALSSLFPITPIDGLDYSYIKSAQGVIELTAPSAFDAEPIKQDREGFDAVKGELPLFRRKMVLTEKEKYQLELYIQAGKEESVKRLLTQIYNDELTLVDGAMMTMEFLRARALTEGRINIFSKGGAVSVDYKVPADQQFTGWDFTTDSVIEKFKEAMDKVEDNTGVRPAGVIMNRTSFKKVRDNPELAQYLSGVITCGGTALPPYMISDEAIIATLKDLTGLKEVIVYDKKVQLDGIVSPLIADNKLSFFPEGQLGGTMVGISPAEMAAGRANAAGASISVTGEGIAVNVTTETKAPYSTQTEVEFVALPSFIKSDQIALAELV